MAKSKTKKARLKAEREGSINPEILRGEWIRKPYTQVTPNAKAQQRRSQCRRKGSRDGADFFPPKYKRLTPSSSRRYTFMSEIIQRCVVQTYKS